MTLRLLQSADLPFCQPSDERSCPFALRLGYRWQITYSTTRLAFLMRASHAADLSLLESRGHRSRSIELLYRPHHRRVVELEDANAGKHHLWTSTSKGLACHLQRRLAHSLGVKRSSKLLKQIPSIEQALTITSTDSTTMTSCSMNYHSIKKRSSPQDRIAS